MSALSARRLQEQRERRRQRTVLGDRMRQELGDTAKDSVPADFLVLLQQASANRTSSQQAQAGTQDEPAQDDS